MTYSLTMLSLDFWIFLANHCTTQDPPCYTGNVWYNCHFLFGETNLLCVVTYTLTLSLGWPGFAASWHRISSRWCRLCRVQWIFRIGNIQSQSSIYRTSQSWCSIHWTNQSWCNLCRTRHKWRSLRTNSIS